MSIKLSAFDLTQHLDSDEAIAVYLNEFIDESDSDLFLTALADAARARHEQGGRR
jgi:probable addiction module antidote protein